MHDNAYYSAFERTRGEALLLQRVSYLLSTSLVVTALTAYASRNLDPTLALPLCIVALVLLFGMRFVEHVPVVNLLCLYAFAALKGLIAGPALAYVVRYVPNGAAMISLAFCLSATATAGVGMYVWSTAKDFDYLGKGLVIALWGAIGVTILAWFLPALRSAPIQLLISVGILVLFVGFLFYDFSNIRHRYDADDYVPATIELYLDFINIFWAVLRILLILSGNWRGRD